MPSQDDRSTNETENTIKEARTTDVDTSSQQHVPLSQTQQRASTKAYTGKNIYVEGVGFLLVLWTSMLGSIFIYSFAHGINYLQIYTNPGIIFQVEFIGGGRNAYSVGFEVASWTFLGVGCRIAYHALKAMHEGTFRFFKYVAIWFGTYGFAWGVGVAIIFSLSVISLNISGTTITLADASIETLIAISFIIGFYNEHALKLLEQVRDKLATSIEGEH
jgi:hypothetical protein